jgi:hypothetical protein
VPDKTKRVQQYQDGVVREAMQIMGAMGARGPDDVTAHQLIRRTGPTTTFSYAELYDWLEPGELIAQPPEAWAGDWARANPDSFD